MTMQTAQPLMAQNFESYQAEAYGAAMEAVNRELILDTPYQRGSVWTLEQRRNLVRSWLLGLPVPTLILNGRATHAWEVANGELAPRVYAVVDGKQRIETAIAWFTGNLDVPASWFAEDWVKSTHDTDDGPYVTYDELADVGQRYLKRQAKLPRAVAQVPTVAAEAMIFGLVNGGGTPQDDESMDRAAKVAAGD